MEYILGEIPASKLLTLLVPLAGCSQKTDMAQNHDAICPESRQRLASQDGWQRAERAIKRLGPSAFPELPPAIRRRLETHGCLIPQVAERGGSAGDFD
jgi:hypothetical protein